MKKAKKTILTRVTWLKVRVGVDEDCVIVWNRCDGSYSPAPLEQVLSKETRLDVRHGGKIFKDCRIVQGHKFVPSQTSTHTSGDHPPQYSSSFSPARVRLDNELYLVTPDGVPTSLFVKIIEGKVVRNEEGHGYYGPEPFSPVQVKRVGYLGIIEMRIVKR